MRTSIDPIYPSDALSLHYGNNTRLLDNSNIKSPYQNSERTTPTAVLPWKAGSGRNNKTNEKDRDRDRDKDGMREREMEKDKDMKGGNSVYEERKRSSPVSKGRAIKLEKEKIEIEKRRQLEHEHQSMQRELVRTSEALDTLQQLLRDREKSGLRKEKLFHTEKESLKSEIENMKISVDTADDEISQLLREREYMISRMDEFGKQLKDLTSDEIEDENNFTDSPIMGDQSTIYFSPNEKMKKRFSSGMGNDDNCDDIIFSSRGTVEATNNNINNNKNNNINNNNKSGNKLSKNPGGKDNFNENEAGWKRQRSRERGKEKNVLESEGAIELDVVIRSMQNVLNDRKRVRRLCRHQQLSIMALR